MRSGFLISSGALIGLALLAACSSGDSPASRREALVEASLKVLSLEHQALEQGAKLEGEPARAESLWLAAVALDPAGVRGYVAAGGGDCAALLAELSCAAAALEVPVPAGEPAAEVEAVFAGLTEGQGLEREALRGYAAAFQLNLEEARDGTVMQQFVPFLLALEVPLTLRDLGLEGAGPERLQAIAGELSPRIRTMPYETSAFKCYLTMVRLDSWAARRNGQVTPDTVAAPLLAEAWFAQVRPRLAALPSMKLGFLGDSHMDRIHWSTPAPFPDIVAAVLKEVNPGIEVVNAGKGGDDSGEALARLERDLASKHPQLTYVMLGGNDASHYGRPQPAVIPEKYRENMAQIVATLRAVGGEVVLVSYAEGPELAEPNLGVLRQFNVILPELRDSLGTGWLDLAAAIETPERDRFYSLDRVHFNPDGHRLIARQVLEHLAARADSL